jgi:hypothetical protein
MQEMSQSHKTDHYHTRFPELVILWEHIFALRKNTPRIIELGGWY